MEVNGQLHVPATSSRGKVSQVPYLCEVWWAPGLVWTLWRREDLLALLGFEPLFVSLRNNSGKVGESWRSGRNVLTGEKKVSMVGFLYEVRKDGLRWKSHQFLL